MESLNLSDDFIEMIVSKVTERVNENLKENNNKINDLQANFDDQSEDFKGQLLDYISDNLSDINDLGNYINGKITITCMVFTVILIIEIWLGIF